LMRVRSAESRGDVSPSAMLIKVSLPDRNAK
jgi:hypothetical protein